MKFSVVRVRLLVWARLVQRVKGEREGTCVGIP